MKHDLLLRHPPLPWILDATLARTEAAELDALPWDRVFDEQDQLEAGGIANPAEQRQVGHYWLRDPMRAPTVGQARAIGEANEAVRSFAEDVVSGAIRAREGRYTDLVWIGIGGSALGPQLLLETCAGEGLSPTILDNVDPDGIRVVLDRLEDRLATTLVVIASKSGSTPEPMACLALVRERLAERGLDDPSRLVAVTQQGSLLDKLAAKEGWRASFPLWDWVGGRFSVTSVVGVLPAALCGIDVPTFLGAARDMDHWTRTRSWRDNPAALLAGVLYLRGNGHGDRSLAVIPYRDRLSSLARFLQQLVMESVGKRTNLEGEVVEQGLTVFGNKGSTDQHALVQQLRDGRNDFIGLLVQILEDEDTSSTLEVAEGCVAGDLLQGFLLGTRRALAEGERPVLTLSAARIDVVAMGSLIALFERAVGLYGSLIEVNPYDQPGVEAGKKAAKDLLALSRRVRAASTTLAVSAEALAEQLDADPVEVWYVCERLVATRRMSRVGDDPPRYRAPRGHER